MAEGSAAAVAVEVFQGDAPADTTPDAGSTPAPAVSEGKPTDTKEPPTPEAKPEGDPPPWWERVAKGKWKNEDEALKGYAESSKEARAKAKEAEDATKKAAELETQWNGVATWFGAPKDEAGQDLPYDIKLPEGAELDPAARDGWEKYLRTQNVSNAKAQEVFDSVILPLEAGRELGRREYERERVVEALGGGDKAVAEAAAIEAFGWAAGVLGDNEAAIEDLRECGAIGAATNTLARLRAAMTGVTMGRSSGGGTGVLDKAGYEAILKEPNSMNDPAKAAKVSEYLNRITGK
jgi:hypothetical protein